jgi:hypothetical protein
MPHPTPQYGQTLRTWLLLIGDLLQMKNDEGAGHPACMRKRGNTAPSS